MSFFIFKNSFYCNSEGHFCFVRKEVNILSSLISRTIFLFIHLIYKYFAPMVLMLKVIQGEF